MYFEHPVAPEDGTGVPFCGYINFDAFVKSRHSGENRSPETLQLIEKTGLRLSPE